MMVVYALVIIGALNWGLVGLGWLISSSDWNIVHMLVGQWMQVEAVIYVLVGLAGVYKLVMCSKGCNCNCNTNGMMNK
jgi:uncharacterized membrane protein YuzA (DUF378 family)